MQTLNFFVRLSSIVTGAIEGIEASWKYGKIYIIERLFLSQMFTSDEIHVNHIHESKSCGHQATLFVDILGGTIISSVDHDELTIVGHTPSQTPCNNRRVTTRIHVAS